MKRFFAVLLSILPLVASCDKAEFEGDYVDLGLSVKWARCNLGASSPGRYGDFYAWGDTDSKMVFHAKNYKYCGSDSLARKNIFTKYCNDPEEGPVDNLTRLERCDDAASAVLGGRWRMPTDQEMQELFEKCECYWIDGRDEYYEVPGYVFHSKLPGYEGRELFLPAFGIISCDWRSKDRTDGYYLTSDLYEENCNNALCVQFNKEDGYHYMALSRIYYGFQIRPVRD